MVTQAKRNSDDMPFIELDMDEFNKTRSHTPDEVRQYLQDTIDLLGKKNENAEDLSEDGNERDQKQSRIKNGRNQAAENSAKKDLELFEKDPETYTTLFSIKKNSEETISRTDAEGKSSDVEQSKTSICVDENNNLFLAVDILRPADVSFQIQDGKLSFDPKGMSPDKLKEMLSYLERRGLLSLTNLDSIKLENADEETLAMFEEAQKEKKDELGDEEQIITSEGEEELKDTPKNDNKLNIDEVREPEGEENHTEGERTDDIPVTTPANNSAEALGNAKAAITKWMDKNKRRNLSYFVSHKDGYTVFTTFDKENPDNMKLDGVLDNNTNDVKVRHECKIYVKQGKNGKVEISFSTSGTKPLSDAYADLIMDAHKDAGNTRVKFGKMTDANEGVIRAACGRAMIVPVGLKLSQTKFDKMIDAAEGKNGKNNPKVLKYKRDLAMQFAYQLQQKGIDWHEEKNKNNVDCRCIRNAIGAYNFTPFHDLWEDFGLRNEYENIIREGLSGNSGAAATIGATQAVTKLYAAYGEAVNSNEGTLDYLVSAKCKSLTSQEKEEFKKAISGMEKTSIRDIPPEKAILLFKLMQKTQEKRASQKIEEEYKRLINDKFYKGNAARDAVRPYLEDAVADIENVKGDLTEYGAPIGVMKQGTPKYDFSNLHQRMSAQRQAPANTAGNSQAPLNALRNRNGATYH